MTQSRLPSPARRASVLPTVGLVGALALGLVGCGSATDERPARAVLAGAPTGSAAGETTPPVAGRRGAVGVACDVPGTTSTPVLVAAGRSETPLARAALVLSATAVATAVADAG